MSIIRSTGAIRISSRWGLVVLALVADVFFASSVSAARVRVDLPHRSATLPLVTVAGQSYVEGRSVAGLVSGQFHLDAGRGQASLQVGGRTLFLSLRKNQIQIADRNLVLSYSPMVRGSQVLLPVEVVPIALAERYGQKAVDWDPRKRLARIRLVDVTITQIRVGTYPSHTRVVLDTAGPLEWSIHEDKGQALRVVVPGGTLAPDIHPVKLRTGIVREIQSTQQAGGVEVSIIRNQASAGIRSFALKDPDRIVIDVLNTHHGEPVQTVFQSGAQVSPSTVSDSPASRSATWTDAPPTDNRPVQTPARVPERLDRATNGSTPAALEPEKGIAQAVPPANNGEGGTQTQLRGAVTVVLDPGHGGHDTGAIGPTGRMEKDVVLDLALRLRRLLQERLAIRVIMTRTEDVFVPLQDRTAIANRARADFFISLHVNAARKRGAVGFETFYFTRESSDSDARASAQRENLVIEADGARGKDQESLLRITLADMAVTRDMRESSELAELVLTSLDNLLRVENRGVKSGPFYVLATAAMPAILVESAFITNPREERKLQQEDYRQRVAEALFEGVSRYKARYERRVGMRGGASAASGS